MINYFEIFAEKLTALEEGQRELRALLTANSTHTADNEPYGDFHWLRGTCPGVPASTLRIKSAAGEIPGTVKFGKRVLYEKAKVFDWLRSKTRQVAPDAAEMNRAAEEQVNGRLAQYSTRRQSANLQTRKTA